MEISQILFHIESDYSANADCEIHPDGALQARSSFHDLILVSGERQELEINERWNLRREITRERNFLVEDRVEDCKQSIDGKRLGTDLYV